MQSQAYINYGRVVVDCPYGCRNAYKVDPGTTKLLCNAKDTGCNYEFEVTCDARLPELFEELSKRPKAENRNWFPTGHPIAVRGGFPMGQTVADLAAEFAMERGTG